MSRCGPNVQVIVSDIVEAEQITCCIGCIYGGFDMDRCSIGKEEVGWPVSTFNVSKSRYSSDGPIGLLDVCEIVFIPEDRVGCATVNDTHGFIIE